MRWVGTVVGGDGKVGRDSGGRDSEVGRRLGG